MDTSAIDNMLGQLRAGAAAAAHEVRGTTAPVVQKDFVNLLRKSIDGVNNSQIQATQLAQDFELGVPNTNLNDVLISMQKANLSFQQVVQVRNRLVAAYHDVMNMQV